MKAINVANNGYRLKIISWLSNRRQLCLAARIEISIG
jgi:hypothetical protein